MKEMRDDEIIFSTPERGGIEHRSISAHTPYSVEKDNWPRKRCGIVDCECVAVHSYQQITGGIPSRGWAYQIEPLKRRLGTAWLGPHDLIFLPQSLIGMTGSGPIWVSGSVHSKWPSH